MEIMTTWNADFKFDLQRFTDYTYSLKDLEALLAKATGNLAAVNFGADGSGNLVIQGVDSGVVATQYGTVTYTLNSSAASLTQTNAGDDTVVADGTKSWTLTTAASPNYLTVATSTTTPDSTVELATDGVMATFGATVSEKVGGGAEKKVLVLTTANTANDKVTVKSGFAKISSGTAKTLIVFSDTDGNDFSFTPAASESLTVGNDGTVYNLATGAKIAVASAESVTTSGAGTFTVNGDEITVTGGAVTFTTKNSTTGGVTAVTGLASNGSISGLTANAAVGVMTGTYTVNGVKFTASGDGYTVAPDDATTPTTITLTSFGTDDKITLDSANESIIVTDGTSTFTAVKGAVSIAGPDAPAKAVATLGANGQSVTIGTTAVTLKSSGTVTVDGDGKLDGLGLGETVDIGNYTIAISKNAAGKTIITQTDKTTPTSPVTTVYQFKSGVTTIDTADVTTFAGLSGEPDDVEKYTPDNVYTTLSNGGTAALSSTLENTGTQVFASTASSTGTEYARLYRTDANTYQLSFNTNISSFSNGVTVDASALPSSATLTVYATDSPDTTYYKTANGQIRVKATDVGSGNAFTIKGDTVDVSGATTRAFEVTSGYVKFDDTNATTITTAAGTFTLTEGTNGTATTITSAGVFTDVDAGGVVVLQANEDANEGATSTFSVNGKSYTAVSETGATITLSASSVPYLSAGSLVIDNTTVNVGVVTTSVKVSGGDGVVYNATSGLLSDLENGETVTVIDATKSTTGALGTPYKTVYTVTNGVLEVAQYYLETSTKPETQHYYTLTGDAISATGVTPTTGEYEATTTYTATFGGSTTQDVSDGKALYIQKDGSTSMTSDSKTVGTLSVSNNVATYEAVSSAKGQTITVGSNTNNDAVDWSMTGTGNADTITYNATSDASINAGNGKDIINLTGASTTSEVSLNAGDGNNTINLRGSGSYTVVMGNGKNTIDASGAGEYSITAGSGGSKIDRTGGTAVNGNATIVGGSGKDSIKAAGADDVVSGGDGADAFDVTTTSITINDYAYGSDVLVASAAGTAPAITATNFGADGVVTVGAVQADVSVGTGTGDFWAVSLVDGDGKNKKNVGFAKESGSNIDVMSVTDNLILVGSNNDDAGDALYSGSGKDTIYGGSNDSVYGGAGKDVISLTGTGAVVGVATTSGKDTVTGFATGYEDSDKIFMVDGSMSDVSVSFASNTLTFKDGDGSLQLNNINAATSGAVELLVGSSKFAVAAENGVISTDSSSYADYYVGKNTAVSFASVDGGLSVDLRNGLDSTAEGAKFSGITAVAGGSGKNTLIGGTGAESLVAGTGTSSLWGGAGKDTLVGNSYASHAFYIGTGDGSDVVTGFTGASSDNADTVYTLSNITGAKLTNSGVEISVGDTDKLTLQNVAADTAIKVNANGADLVAKVGSATSANNFTYDSTVTYYGGGTGSDKIAFSSGYAESAQIWLDGSQGKTYASVDVVDGGNTSGNLIVAGDSSSQSIIGGKGDSSLWGGAGSATDTLRSSSGGSTMFWWGAGEGNDVAISASANDSVNLYNVKLSDVDLNNTAITNSGVTLALNDGSKLTVQTSRDMTFTVDGTSWTAQHSSKEWKRNS